MRIRDGGTKEASIGSRTTPTHAVTRPATGRPARAPTAVLEWHRRGVVEFATLEWVDWFNNRRLLEPIGNIPPAEFEAMYDQTQESPTTEAGLN
jgi:hypothetical protein